MVLSFHKTLFLTFTVLILIAGLIGLIGGISSHAKFLVGTINRSHEMVVVGQIPEGTTGLDANGNK